MSYIDLGFTNMLYKTLPNTISELPEDEASQSVQLLTAGAIAGGTTKSASGRIQIDWDKGQILIGDGAHWRVNIGEDGL